MSMNRAAIFALLLIFWRAMPQVPPGAAEKYVTVYGAKIHYLEAGSGPAVILLHGLGGDALNWAATIGPLSQKYRVIVPDQIGFGKSDKPLMSYRVGTYVDFLEGFYRELKLERASLVGNSLGGWIAAAFALAHPQKVDKLVLVDSAGYSLPKDFDPRIMRGLNASTREGIKQMLPFVFYNRQLFANDAVAEMLFARKVMVGDGYTIEKIIESIIRGEDVLDGRLSQLKHPTLIVWGRQDMLTPLWLGERLKKEIPNSELLIIEECGHVPQIEKPAEFNSALINFLGSSK